MASCTRTVDPSVIAEMAEELRYLLIIHDKAATQLKIIGIHIYCKRTKLSFSTHLRKNVVIQVWYIMEFLI